MLGHHYIFIKTLLLNIVDSNDEHIPIHFLRTIL